MPILLEQGVDPRNSSIPRVLEVFQRQSPILSVGLLALQRVLRPHPLTIDELALPGLHVPKKVRDDLIFFVRHAAPKMRDALVRLLRVAEVLRVMRLSCGHVDDIFTSSSSFMTLTQHRLRNQHVAHGQHAQAAQLFWGVEHDGREARGHLGIQANFYPRLDLIFALDLRTVSRKFKVNFNTPSQHQQVQHFLRVHDGLAEVRHQSYQSRVPFIGNFCEGRRAARHEDLADAIFKRSQGLLVDLRIGSKSEIKPATASSDGHDSCE